MSICYFLNLHHPISLVILFSCDSMESVLAMMMTVIEPTITNVIQKQLKNISTPFIIICTIKSDHVVLMLGMSLFATFMIMGTESRTYVEVTALLWSDQMIQKCRVRFNSTAVLYSTLLYSDLVTLGTGLASVDKEMSKTCVGHMTNLGIILASLYVWCGTSLFVWCGTRSGYDLVTPLHSSLQMWSSHQSCAPCWFQSLERNGRTLQYSPHEGGASLEGHGKSAYSNPTLTGACTFQHSDNLNTKTSDLKVKTSNQRIHKWNLH